MARKVLQLAPDFAVPLDFATEGVAVIGMRGSGKSNSEVRWFEVCHEAGIPCVAVDPKGDWGGIRSSADGKHPGLAVPVFGGLNGDFPLGEQLGRRIADLLVDKNLSAVLDVSRLSIGSRARFLTDFFNQLIDRHQREPHVRCVILEEAHRYIPQEVTKATAAVKEAAASILLEGRAFGLGCWAATQRPARLHKDVLEEVGTAIIHRIGAAATNDLRTIAGWVKHEDLGAEIVPSLTKLADGEAWVLAPSTLGIARRVRIDRRRTFDSAATPLVGAGSRPVVTMADIDSAAINEALADAIEKARTDDPVALRRELADARQRIAVLERAAAAPPLVKVEEVEVPVLDEALVKRLEEALVPAAGVLADVQERLTWEVSKHGELLEFRRRLGDGGAYLPGAGRAGGGGGAVAERAGPARAGVADVVAAPPASGRAEERDDPPRRRAVGGPPGEGTAEGALGLAHRRILSVLAQFDGQLAKGQLATLCTYHERSKGFTNALSALRSSGLLLQGDPVALTDEGERVAATLDIEPLPAPGAPLVEFWKAQPKIGKAAGLILDVLLDAYPASVDKDELAEACGYHPRSKGFSNALSQLRGLGLVERGEPRLSATLGG